MIIRTHLYKRTLIFTLASMSFACLLGQMYALWTMKWFACWLVIPATVVLIVIAIVDPYSGPDTPRNWILHGAIAGVIAAIAYDLYRLPFVLYGIPLFKVFPRFGQLLLNADGPMWLAQLLGWTYHFSNGAALGVMYLAVMSPARGPRVFWGAVTWALLVETIMLLTPYANFFALKLDARFLFLTASAHLIFGVALGLYCARRANRSHVSSGFATAHSQTL